MKFYKIVVKTLVGQDVIQEQALYVSCPDNTNENSLQDFARSIFRPEAVIYGPPIITLVREDEFRNGSSIARYSM